MTDRFEEIKIKWNIPAVVPMNVQWGKDDVAWLVGEVERLRECACAGCLSADADPRMHTCEDGHVRDTLAKLRAENLSLREEMDVMRRTHKAEVERLHTVNAMLVGGTVTYSGAPPPALVECSHEAREAKLRALGFDAVDPDTLGTPAHDPRSREIRAGLTTHDERSK